MSAHLKCHDPANKSRFQCDKCDKTFSKKSGMQKHQNAVHLGIKTFQCPQCDKAFYRKEHLQKHQDAVHLGLKMFQCPQCDKAFSQKENMQNHQNEVHLGLRPFKCDQCTQDFSRKCDLNRHVSDIHLGLKPYQCRVCNEKFSQAGNMMKHMQSAHTDAFNAAKKQEEEKVRSLLTEAGYLECFELGDALPPPGAFKREHHVSFDCAEANSTSAKTGNPARWCRIDFIINVGCTFIFLEVDEMQHRFGYGSSLSCDSKRMTDVAATLLLCQDGAQIAPIHWMRYNSHGYHVAGETVRVAKEVRQRALLDSIEKVSSGGPPEEMRIEYLWYDIDEDGELEVVQNDDYNDAFRSIAFQTRRL